MRILRFDAGETWDNPNARWGDPSYVLEPGDPGYIPPHPSPEKPRRHRTMSNNPIPVPERPMLALAEDVADGCATHETEVGLKAVKEADLRLSLTALKGSPTAAPPVLGLIYLFKQAELATGAAEAERRAKDGEVKTFLSAARTSLVPILGAAPSAEWALAGFTNGQGNSNAVPSNQEARLQCLSALAVYLSQHPTYEVPAGTPRPEVTAARALLLHQQLSNCRQAANSASTAQGVALNNKTAGFGTLRRQLIALVDELQLRLADDDERWEVFGLNIPANPRAPEPATDLDLSNAGTGRVAAEWTRGTRSNDDRIFIQVVGVDPDWREYGKSGGDSEELLKNLPSGATVKVKIIALNGSLAAADGPVAQIVVT